MRAVALSVAFLLCCVALGGCRLSDEVENQAYVLALGVDRLADGKLALTARVPKIGGRSATGDQAGDDGSPYLTFRATGDGWTQAKEALQWVTPRSVNLSHIELLVISQALASEAGFPALATGIARTPHLYTTARFVVCDGDAGDFVAAGETVIGTRMSAEINAMLKHYADEGYIPEVSFADYCFAANSIYSDPVAIHGYSEPMDNTRPDEGEQDKLSQRFSGAALFREGVFIRALSLEETRLLELIRGEANVLVFERGGVACELTPDGPPSIHVRLGSEAPHIELSVRLTTQDELTDAETASLETGLADAMEALITSCQRLAAEPFGFAEVTAGQFATVKAWLDYNWRNRFADASIVVKAMIQGT